MEKNNKKILGFISHRCKDYDNAQWRKIFENFLISKGITPIYGCFLEKNFRGILSNNIQNAMKKGDIYIAVITDSWQKENEGWPKKEWEMWQEINQGNEKLERCFGLLIDIKRHQVRFIQDLISYEVSGDNNSVDSLEFFDGNPTPYYINNLDYSRMNDQIDRFVNEVKRGETVYLGNNAIRQLKNIKGI